MEGAKVDLYDRARHWNTTAPERAATYPCESYAREPYRRYLRALDVDAPADTTFRWLCQLKVAPYSYDWIDNAGRRSPRTLTPGAEDLATGQRFLIARIVDFEAGHHLTGVSTPGPTRVFGPIAITYQVSRTGAGSSRLVAAMTVSASTLPGRVRRWLLGWGDLVMMRKQLLTLAGLAERQARTSTTST